MSPVKRPSKARDSRAGNAGRAHIAAPIHSGTPRDVPPHKCEQKNTAINGGRGTRGDGTTKRSPRR